MLNPRFDRFVQLLELLAFASILQSQRLNNINYNFSVLALSTQRPSIPVPNSRLKPMPRGSEAHVQLAIRMRDGQIAPGCDAELGRVQLPRAERAGICAGELPEDVPFAHVVETNLDARYAA